MDQQSEHYNKEDRSFNKDWSFLAELQRLEIISNNFAIEENHSQRKTSLKCWSSAIWGIIDKEDKAKIKEILIKCKSIYHKGKTVWDTESLDKLHQFLNCLNTKYNLQLTKRKGGESAVGLDMEP